MALAKTSDWFELYSLALLPLGFYRLSLFLLGAEASGCSCLGPVEHLLNGKGVGDKIALVMLLLICSLAILGLALLKRDGPPERVPGGTPARRLAGYLKPFLTMWPLLLWQTNLVAQRVTDHVGFRAEGILVCDFYRMQMQPGTSNSLSESQTFPFTISVVDDAWDLTVTLAGWTNQPNIL